MCCAMPQNCGQILWHLFLSCSIRFAALRSPNDPGAPTSGSPTGPLRAHQPERIHYPAKPCDQRPTFWNVQFRSWGPHYKPHMRDTAQLYVCIYLYLYLYLSIYLYIYIHTYHGKDSVDHEICRELIVPTSFIIFPQTQRRIPIRKQITTPIYYICIYIYIHSIYLCIQIYIYIINIYRVIWIQIYIQI